MFMGTSTLNGLHVMNPVFLSFLYLFSSFFFYFVTFSVCSTNPHLANARQTPARLQVLASREPKTRSFVHYTANSKHKSLVCDQIHGFHSYLVSDHGEFTWFSIWIIRLFSKDLSCLIICFSEFKIVGTAGIRKLFDFLFTQRELFWLDDILPGKQVDIKIMKSSTERLNQMEMEQIMSKTNIQSVSMANSLNNLSANPHQLQHHGTNQERENAKEQHPQLGSDEKSSLLATSSNEPQTEQQEHTSSHINKFYLFPPNQYWNKQPLWFIFFVGIKIFNCESHFHLRILFKREFKRNKSSYFERIYL